MIRVKVFILSTFMCCFCSLLSGQSTLTTLSVAAIDHNEVVDPFAGVISSTDHSSKASLTVEEKATNYDLAVAEDFGLYVNPYSNQVKLKTLSNVTYTKAQLTKVETGEKILSLKDEKGINSLDVSQVEPGMYYLIMTDSQSNILSEEIAIF